VANNPWRYRNQILHFGDRYAFLKGDYAGISESNHIFLTWYHGKPDDPDPNIREMYDLLPAALPHIKTIVASCEEGKADLIAGGVPAEQIVMIPIGVDTSHFVPPTPEQRQAARQKLDIPDDVFCIGSFQKDGRGWGDGMEPKPIKGPDVLVDVVAQVHGRHENVMVLLSGPARGYVKAQLDKIGVPYRHRFYDHYPDVLECYHAADCTLITSRSEGGPKAFMESWATGVPVVSTKMGMPADHITSGENGLLADVDDSVTLAAQVEHLLLDAALRRQLTEAANANPFDWSVVARQHDDLLYAPILESGI
jgi:glycosyltransferase involved in cell wall biosynthesis